MADSTTQNTRAAAPARAAEPRPVSVTTDAATGETTATLDAPAPAPPVTGPVATAMLAVRSVPRPACARVVQWSQQVTNAYERIAEVVYGGEKIGLLVGVPGPVSALIRERADTAIRAGADLLAALATVPEDARPDPIAVGVVVAVKQAKRAAHHGKPWARADLIVVARMGDEARIWCERGEDVIPAKHLEPSGATLGEVAILKAAALAAGKLPR